MCGRVVTGSEIKLFFFFKFGISSSTIDVILTEKIKHLDQACQNSTNHVWRKQHYPVPLPATRGPMPMFWHHPRPDMYMRIQNMKRGLVLICSCEKLFQCSALNPDVAPSERSSTFPSIWMKSSPLGDFFSTSGLSLFIVSLHHCCICRDHHQDFHPSICALLRCEESE